MTAYTKSAVVYDAINASRSKDYAREVGRIHELVQQYRRSEGSKLLDVACGTGQHVAYLRQYYCVEGLDISADMLAIARDRFPDVPFYEASMIGFDLERQYDVITCLFSSIGYVQTVENMRRAVAAMAKHLLPGGVAIVEPYFHPDTYKPGNLHATFVSEPDIKIARMAVHAQQGTVSVMDMHFMVATAHGIDQFTELHEMGLFTKDEYAAAFQDAGLTVAYDPQGLIGRGLYIGVKPA
jgi:ubiquinone/menaquinone biosynthesis C-methylase UbiE